MNSADQLSSLTGLSRADLDAAWIRAKENVAKLKGCKRHRFSGGKTMTLGAKHECLECGGTVGQIEIGYYVNGYQAAGGDAQDIWPEWPR